jgi:methionyl-tRNA synthetase
VKEIAYGGDGDFTWERYQERYNVDLANNLGNLVSRLATMAEKFRGLRLAPAGEPGRLAGVAAAALERYTSSMDRWALHEGAAAAFSIVDAANEYIAENAPWQLARDPANEQRLSGVLFDVAEAIRVAAVLLLPIMPRSAAEILRRVGETRAPAELRLDRDGAWRHAGERQMVKGAAMWPRAEESRVPAEDERRAGLVVETRQEESTVEETSPPAVPLLAPVEDPRITIDDFMKTELRVAKVLEAEAVPKSKKLIRMKVDVGEAAPRQILAGIAEGYQPEQLVGRTIVIVSNLKPARLMGLESNGMVLAASSEGGVPTLLAVDERIPAGTRVRYRFPLPYRRT